MWLTERLRGRLSYHTIQMKSNSQIIPLPLMSTRCTLAVRTSSSSHLILAGYYSPLTPSAGLKFLVACCAYLPSSLDCGRGTAVADSCALLAAAVNVAGCRPWVVATPRHRCFRNKSITTRGVSTLSHVTGQNIRTGVVARGCDIEYIDAAALHLHIEQLPPPRYVSDSIYPP